MGVKDFFKNLYNSLNEGEPKIEEGDDSWYDELSQDFENADEWRKFSEGELMSHACFTYSTIILQGNTPDFDTILEKTEVYPFLAELTSLYEKMADVTAQAYDEAQGFGTEQSDADATEQEIDNSFSHTVKIDVNTFVLKCCATGAENNVTLDASITIN